MKFPRQVIERLEGYVPGFQPKEKGFIKLNTNENPYPPSPKVLAALREGVGESLKLYPDPMADRLRNEIAATFGFRKSWIMVGNGSDELLNLAMRACVGKGDRVWVTDPTYVLYEVLAKMQEAKVVRCVLDKNFDLPDRLELDGVKLAMISNPNTPTGTLFARGRLEEICRRVEGFVLVDEAYADFATRHCAGLVKKYRNVIVTRSLSKSFSLAGLRIGFALARPEVIESLMKLKDSYNVNSLSQAAALAAVRDWGWMRQCVRRVVRDREFLTRALERLGFTVIPSQANFIFVRYPKMPAAEIFDGLYGRKILVRHFNLPRLSSFLRISIGTHREMIKLILALKEILTP